MTGVLQASTLAQVHPSHKTRDNWDGPDPHSHQVECTVCDESACVICGLEEGHELTLPCIGFSWYDAVWIEVAGRKVAARKSGTGWPK